MTKTIINTARSKNLDDWKGFTIYVTRTPQRCKKYFADAWNEYLGNHFKTLEAYQENNFTQFFFTDELKHVIIPKFKKHKEITLICYCKDVNKCHRKILANFLVDTYPKYFTKGQIK